MKCLAFKELERNTLQGFATLEMASGLVFNDCTLHVSGERQWVSPPGRPLIDANGCVVSKDGKAQYAQVVTFASKEQRDKWSAAAVKAIEAFRGRG